MILSSEQVRLIRAGKKTEHRIPVTDPAARHPGDHPGFGNRPRIGLRIPVSTRELVDGKPTAVPQTTIVVTAFHRQKLGESLSVASVRAEGHRTTGDYKTWWVKCYDKGWCRRSIDPARWFRLPYGTPRSDRRLAALEAVLAPDHVARFDARHAGTEVWVLTIEPERVASDRFIALDGRGDEHGYTTRPEMAVRGIPPAVDEQTQRRFSDKARDHHALRTAGVAEESLERLRGLDAEIYGLRQLGLSQGYDLRPQIKRLQQTRDAIEAKIRQQAQRAA